MNKSTRNPIEIRSRLMLRGTSIPKIARKHRACVSSVYAVVNGQRPGTRSPAVQRAMEEIHRD